MRLGALVYISLLIISPAYAYVEEDTAGMTEMSAGDQNTNMHKLSARGDYFVKKLKKLDEYAVKNGGRALDISDVDDIVSFEEKTREEQLSERILANVTATTAEPQRLKIVVKPEVYSTLAAVNEVRDAEIASMLQKQLKRGRR